MSKLLSAFITCHNLSEDLIDSDIFFISNANKINNIKKDEQRTLAELHIKYNPQILVIDKLNYFMKFLK